MNEDAIDDKLKCIICTQPFQSPVNLDCQHTFCQFCIETWIKTNASCPICRRQFETNHVLTKVTNSSVYNQLDSLLVRCLRCNKIGIERNNFSKHLQRCSKSRMTRFSDSIQNRWRSMTRTTESKRDRQAILHQIRVARASEILNTNHEQQGTHYPQPHNVHLRSNEQQFSNFRTRVFPETTLSRSATLHPHQRIQVRDWSETSRQQRQPIFYICVFIVAILCLIIFRESIICFLQLLGKLILLLICLYLWIKLGQVN